MSTAALFFGIIFIRIALASTSASISHCISCPCGSGNQNYTHCIDNSLSEDITCERWSHCQTCKANTTFCISCPPGRIGLTCFEISDGHIRKKRQDEPNLLNHPWQYGSCPRLQQPESGSIRCTQRGNERSCTFTCLPGYHLEGRENVNEITLRCNGRGWTPQNNFPPCVSGGYCELRVTGAGFYNCTTDMRGTHCDITCDGYYRGRFHCYPDRPWNPRLPFCIVPKERVSCSCQNGGVCDVNGRCMCPEGRTGTYCENLERQKANCDDPGIPREGSRLNPDGSDASFPRVFEEGESVIFTCNGENRALQGPSIITCLEDGTWSANLPRCISTPREGSTVYCPDPGFIQFGSRSDVDDSRRSSRYTNGESVVYYCYDGYELIGNSMLTCLDTGRWSSERPFCRRVNFINRPTEREPAPGTSCRHPGAIVNGFIEDNPLLDPRMRGQTFPPSTELKFDCKEGFEPVGPTILFCMTSGQWTSPPPTCRKIATTTPEGREPGEGTPCRHPGVDMNGFIEEHPLLDPRIRGQTFPPNTALSFDCNKGFEPEGPTILFCQTSGEWTSAPPTCKESPPASQVTCNPPEVDENGGIIDDPGLDPRGRRKPFPVDYVLTFICNDGFEPEGSTEITCLSNGQWTSNPPKCLRKSGDSDPAPSEVTQSCPIPEVNPNVVVDEFQVVDPRKLSSFKPGDELNFSCNEGYDLEGPETIECYGNGKWSSQVPICVPKRRTSNPRVGAPRFCESPEVDPNAEVESLVNPLNSMERFEPDSELTFRCKEGYVLEGWATIRCVNGRWSNSSPKCNIKPRTSGNAQISCANPGPISNGRVVVFRPSGDTSDNDDDYEFSFGTHLKYICNDGYFLVGAESLDCGSNSYWNGSPPMCTEDCGRSLVTTTDRVTHGNRTTAGEWPWTVAIAADGNIVCGGALIDRRTVITAAHCLPLADNFTLFFGKYIRSDEFDGPDVRMGRSYRLISHPDFNSRTFDNDIAIIKFQPAVRYSKMIQPICLPTPKSTSTNVVPKRKGYVSGWGTNEDQVVTDELMVAQIPVQSNETCLAAYQKRNLNPRLNGDKFCAGYKDGKINTCTGDSGSPLVFYEKGSNRYILEGIVSFGINGECTDPEKYTVFAKVSNFMSWILRNRRSV